MFIKVLAHYILLQHNIRRATIYNTWLLTRFCYYRSVWYCRIVSQLNSFHDGNMGSYPTTISNYHRFRIINHSIGIILIAKRMSVAINDSYIPADVAIITKSNSLTTRYEQARIWHEPFSYLNTSVYIQNRTTWNVQYILYLQHRFAPPDCNISTLITSSSKRTFRTPQRNHIKMDTYITPYFSSFYSAKEYIRTANGWNLNSLFQWERLEVEQQGVINGLYYFYEHKILRQIKIYFPINIIMYFSSWISHINTIVIHVTCYDRRHTNNRV